jgi:catechol 2,3-dioxygenase-like lactoylglutathione lyase family enzyme
MLKVPNVDVTVDYWKSKGGRVRISRSMDELDTDATTTDINKVPLLRSAFIEMGCSGQQNNGDNNQSSSSSSPVTFALELVRTTNQDKDDIGNIKKPYRLGNEICYIGISKLLLFQNDLLGVITGEATAKKIKKKGSDDEDQKEPNGIDVQSSASAPGDFFARFCLRSNNLAATSKFYSEMLGMDIKAQDDQMLCVRYDNDNFPSSTFGVATTLVFVADATTPIEKGDCFDHIAITTSSSIDELYTRYAISKPTTSPSSGDDDDYSTSSDDVKIFMKPIDMFGKRVMGLIDPNGYKVVLAGR